MISSLWQILNSINPDTFENDSALKAYIYKSLSNYCKNTLYTNPKLNIIYNSEIANIELEKKSSDELLEAPLIFLDMTKHLPDKQKNIVNLKYNHSLTEAEIAQACNISRQAVYKTKCNALNNLRKYKNEFLN